jgi:hypothetical protein
LAAETVRGPAAVTCPDECDSLVDMTVPPARGTSSVTCLPSSLPLRPAGNIGQVARFAAGGWPMRAD